MCYAVKCGTCGKSTWAGCGRHVASVYAQIQQGQHCLCRQWPGVSLPNQTQNAGAAAAGGSAPHARAAVATEESKPPSSSPIS